MDSAELVKSLVSEVCPACDKTKKERQTFCSRCYYKLSGAQRKALYRLIGEGYEHAFDDAMKTLKPR